MTNLSEAELQRNRQAAKTHGIYAFRDRGEAALDAPQRSRYAELREMVAERPGLLELARDRVTKAVMLAELCEGEIIRRVEAGDKLEDIPLAVRVTTYQEAARRGVMELLKVIPDGGVETVDIVLDSLKETNGNGK